MNRKLQFLLPLTIAGLAGCGNSDQPELTVESAKSQLNQQHVPSVQVFEGTAEQFRTKYILQDGQLHYLSAYDGEVKILDENAKLIAHDRYKAGRLHGLSTKWWKETGNRKLEWTYANGIPSGTKTEWFPDGQLKLEQDFHKGMPDGKEVARYPNGKMQYEHHFKEGKPDGVWSDWDEAGNLLKSIRYQEGKVVEQIHPK